MSDIKLKRYKSVFEKLHEKVCVENNDEVFSFPCRTSSYLVEAVYRPDKYVNILYNQLKSHIYHYNKLFKYGEQVCTFLTERFKEFNIIFEYDGKYDDQESKKYGINSMATGSNSLTIYIYCNPIIKDIFINKKLQENFLQYFREVIGHELIHRSQSISIENYNLQKKLIRDEAKLKYQTSVGYYADKKELMSYAWQIIEELRFQGAYDIDILNYIKDIAKYPQYNCLIYEHVYIKYYRNTKVINQLIKYVYEYLKGNLNINEINIT